MNKVRQCRNAELPIVRFPVRRVFNAADIVNQLLAKLQATS
jgi:hypothetical protein